MTTTTLASIISVLIVFIGWVAANVVSMKVTVGTTENKIDNLLEQHNEHKQGITDLREKVSGLDSRIARLEGHRA